MRFAKGLILRCVLCLPNTSCCMAIPIPNINSDINIMVCILTHMFLQEERYLIRWLFSWGFLILSISMFTDNSLCTACCVLRSSSCVAHLQYNVMHRNLSSLLTLMIDGYFYNNKLPISVLGMQYLLDIWHDASLLLMVSFAEVSKPALQKHTRAFSGFSLYSIVCAASNQPRLSLRTFWFIQQCSWPSSGRFYSVLKCSFFLFWKISSLITWFYVFFAIWFLSDLQKFTSSSYIVYSSCFFKPCTHYLHPVFSTTSL